jgi:hypothetical protein
VFVCKPSFSANKALALLEKAAIPAHIFMTNLAQEQQKIFLV